MGGARRPREHGGLVTLRRLRGRPADGGETGTVRRLSGGPARLAVTETIVAAEAPHRLEYTAKGAPLQWMYHGFVTLEPTAGGGTTIRWEAQFRSPLWGSGAITRQMLQRLTAGLAKAAEVPALAR